jgi:sugar lactone lactonase YvrE
MSDSLHLTYDFTPVNSFTDGAEGPGVDRQGNLYAVNYARQHTIGRVTPQGQSTVFLELPDGSCGNGIRFNRAGDMFIADYTNHNVLRVDMQACAAATTLAERNAAIHLFAHESSMNQPNDLAIMANDILFASDPNWSGGWGQLWRIDANGKVVLLESNMGTTNGVEVSADERTFYVNETVQRRVWAYDLSTVGELSNKRLLYEFPDYGLGGMRCDIAGNLYITRWGKGVIAKLSPQGELLMEIPLNGAKCTNIAFGGEDGCTAYVTMADRGNVETFRVELPGREWQLAQRSAA